MAGKTSLDQALVDSVADTVNEMFDKVIKCIVVQDAAQKVNRGYRVRTI